MHFFSPVPRMPLVEVIPSSATGADVLSTTVAFARRLGKTPIVVRDRPGFWVNRILAPYLNEAGYLLGEGAAIEEIDRLMVNWGFPVGPITLLDEVGLDIALKASEILAEAFGERVAPAPCFRTLVADGRVGRKASRGFYLYRGAQKRGPDPAVNELLGIHPNGGPHAAEILQRLVLVMLNEAARAVGEEVVRHPRDGDVAALYGFGFPPFRGGPLRHADDLGAARLVGELERLAERRGVRYAPCEFLVDLARRGARFYP